MSSVDAHIRSVDAAITGNIEKLATDRGLLSQNILSQLRNLVEGVAVRLHRGSGDVEYKYDAIGPALNFVRASDKFNFLGRFHKLLQISASHYTFEGDASERLMLKYYEYLQRIRILVRNHCDLEILTNLDAFPVNLDPSLREYHEKIAIRIEDVIRTRRTYPDKRSRCYIHKVRPFLVRGQIYYEVTFSPANDRVSKFDRSIAFTKIDMTDMYAANLTLLNDTIRVLDREMPIRIILEWEVSVRLCEFNNFAKLFGQQTQVAHNSEYRHLMQHLTITRSSLLDIVDMTDAEYQRLKGSAIRHVAQPQIFPILDEARRIILRKAPGYNVLRYLLLRMNNRVIKQQLDPNYPNPRLSDLRLSYRCIPFDTMPFCTSLVSHNPRFVDLADSLEISNRNHELLARRVKNNVEQHGMLYTPISDLQDLDQVDQLVDRHNGMIYHKHMDRRLEIDKGHVFIRGYEDSIEIIIKTIQEYATSGLDGYEEDVEKWLNEAPYDIDDNSKKAILRQLFVDSRVALIYGAAGTGKSTLVSHIASYFSDKRKLFLAHTNPAVDNLRRRVTAHNSEFRTIHSHIKRSSGDPEYDLLVIDECSTVSNSDLVEVLKKTRCNLIIFVGDDHQIESIQFGNWFSIIRSFIPSASVFELTEPYRTQEKALLSLWSKVRELDDDIAEVITRNGFSEVLGESLFESQFDDEIILCLNYDGLYGINNINHFLQISNPGREVVWEVSTYKVGDPVLFNETDRFKPVIYNNLKGRIVDIVDFGDRVQFDVRLDRSISEPDVNGTDLRWLGDSTVQFDVFKRYDSDEDGDSSDTVVPFQVAYAVSIHKAQGLEYDSVKVVITDANEEDISHSVFYTAITRARKHLKIYWTPETQQAVLSKLRRTAGSKDVALFSARRGVSPLRARN
jgi:ATP-dependent exoDNAse (exonuclease V), alpha subunit - helicase superfamily I member